MALPPPLKNLDIDFADDGFYAGFNKIVALASKIIIAFIIIWAVAFFIIVCAVIAIHPKWGKTRLGDQNGTPEFSNFSWFSMMFGAGIGIGMIGYATGEPVWHMGDIRKSE